MLETDTITIVTYRQWIARYTITRNPKHITPGIQGYEERTVWSSDINPHVVQPESKYQADNVKDIYQYHEITLLYVHA